MTGHCLGAAGAIEAVFSIKALTTDTVIPTLGYSEEDKEAVKEKAGKLDFVQNVPHAKELKSVMSNSFAFGGNNASIIFSKDKGDVKSHNSKARIAVTGMGIVNAFGNTKDAYLNTVKTDAKPQSSSIHSTVTDADYKDLGLKMAFYRKLDNFSQIQAVSGMYALKDANITVSDDNAKDIGCIVGTSEGALGSTYDFESLIAEGGNSKGSAFKFPHTVYNAAGGYLSICSGLKGYSATVTSGPVSGLTSIAYSMNVIRDGQAKVMMATGNDENIPEINGLFEQLGFVSKEVVAPYSSSDGFVLGDASTSLMLEDEDYAKNRGAKVYCYVLGYGHGRKNVKFGKLSGSESALELALNDALNDAGVKADEIDAIFGFANGMKAVDSIETGCYPKMFANVPVVAVKERVGEGRAGAATLQAAHAALMLNGDIEKDNAYILSSDGSAKRTTVESKNLKKVLVVSYATGGSYSAVVLSK